VVADGVFEGDGMFKCLYKNFGNDEVKTWLILRGMRFGQGWRAAMLELLLGFLCWRALRKKAITLRKTHKP
jgi:hypothetical protein